MIYRRMVAAISSPWSLGLLAVLCAGWVLLGFRVGFQTEWFQFAANTPLSWGAMFISLLILVDARREQRALHMKLDELIRSIGEARNQFMGIEAHDEATLDKLSAEVQDVQTPPGPLRRVMRWLQGETDEPSMHDRP